MNKVAIVFWSGSGNTEAMANAIKEGVQKAGTICDLNFVSDFDVASVGSYDGIMLGCPAMGAEVLEEGEFQPVYDEIENLLSGKPVALFGSYGWGSGEWMENWEVQVKDAGGDLFEKGLIINEAPDEDGLKACEEFGMRFVQSK
ncbi:MAG TPA: flavodoxin [Candidatus Megamonas gallistercoris]|nr:flavodoxin [Candidatus Megamonas gallistercoris]